MCASYFNFLCSFVIYWKLPEIFGFHYEVTTHGAPFVSEGFSILLLVSGQAFDRVSGASGYNIEFNELPLT